VEYYFKLALTAAYFMGAFASLFGILRAYVDYKRTGQRVRLMGISTHGAIFFVCALIAVSAGSNPVFSAEFTRTGIRVGFMTWAFCEMAFGAMYAWIFLHVEKRENAK